MKPRVRVGLSGNPAEMTMMVTIGLPDSAGTPAPATRVAARSLLEKEADLGVCRVRSEEYHRPISEGNRGSNVSGLRRSPLGTTLMASTMLRYGCQPTDFSNQRLAKGSSGRKWRSKAPHMRAKETRGATKARSVAAPKVARTARDRHLAMRRARLDTRVAS